MEFFSCSHDNCLGPEEFLPAVIENKLDYLKSVIPPILFQQLDRENRLIGCEDLEGHHLCWYYHQEIGSDSAECIAAIDDGLGGCAQINVSCRDWEVLDPTFWSIVVPLISYDE